MTTRAKAVPSTGLWDSDLVVRWDPEALDWIIALPLTWTGSDGDAVIVPVGERTDFASVPRILQNIMPATGRWTRAAVIHDMLCRLLAVYWIALQKWPGGDLNTLPPPPRFNAVDTDAVFEKIMKEDGVGPIMRRIGWVGVRWGAAWNPARRKGWARTAPRVLGLSTAFLAAVLAALYVFAHWPLYALAAGVGVLLYRRLKKLAWWLW